MLFHYLIKIFKYFPLCIILPLYSQIGGLNTFEFVNLNTSPKTAALGGYVTSIMDNDVNNGVYNPALINHLMNHVLVLNYTGYYDNIVYGDVGYCFDLWNNNLLTSMKFIDYGQFVETNEFGQNIGSFNAGEYLFSIGSSKSVIDSLFLVGVNVKLAYSSLYEFNSLGMLLDLGVSYNFPNNNITTSILVKNLGYQIIPYYENNRESFPFEIVAGLSNKLAYMPLRWHLTLQHVEKPDVVSSNNNSSESSRNFAYTALRHVVFGAELLLHKNLNLLFGYNNRRRFEMIIEDRKALVGFSFGVVLRIHRFNLTYSRASNHFSGSINSFGISTNFKKID